MKKKTSIFFIAAVLLAFMKGANAGTLTSDTSIGVGVKTPVIGTDVGATADTRADTRTKILDNNASGGVLARSDAELAAKADAASDIGETGEERAREKAIERTRGNVSVDTDTDASLHSRIRDDANDSISSKLKTRSEVDASKDHGTRDGIGLKSKSTVGVGAKVN